MNRKKTITKRELEEIIAQKGIILDISSLPDDAVITDYEITPKGESRLVVTYTSSSIELSK